jgi:hypothetical protein
MRWFGFRVTINLVVAVGDIDNDEMETNKCRDGHTHGKAEQLDGGEEQNGQRNAEQETTKCSDGRAEELAHKPAE